MALLKLMTGTKLKLTPSGTGEVLMPAIRRGVGETGPAGATGPAGPAGTGDVVGPASAVGDNVTSFNSTTGKLVKDSGLAVSAVATLTGSQTLTNKTLTSPTLTTPALGAPASGTLTNCTGLPAAGIGSGTVATARLGSGTANSSTFLRGDSTWATPAGSGDVVGPASSVDSRLALFDSTTGKLLKQASIAESAVATLTGTQTLTNKTITTPAGLVKGDVGLGSVDNTADASKPVSTAQQTALDLKLDKSYTINAQTGTTYTYVLTDAGKYVTFNNASAQTVTVPPNSSVAFPTGTVISGVQRGAGQVTFAQGSGVTIEREPGLKIAARYGSYALVKIATDTWTLVGRLAA